MIAAAVKEDETRKCYLALEDCSSRNDLLEQAFYVIYNLDDDTLMRIMEAISEKTA